MSVTMNVNGRGLTSPTHAQPHWLRVSCLPSCLILLVVGLPTDPVLSASTRSGGSLSGVKARAGGAPAIARPATQTVTVDHLRRILLHYLATWAQGQVTDWQVEILAPTEPIVLPAGPLEVRVKPRGLDEGFGQRLFELSWTANERVVHTVKVLADVSAWAEVVTPVRPIKPDEILEANDLTVTRLQLPALHHDWVTDLQAAIGKRVIRPLRPGSPVRTSMLALPYLVRRGDAVTIEVRHGGLVVQAAGTTKMAGHLGQSVVVTNRDSGKDVRGIVVGPGLVRVTF